MNKLNQNQYVILKHSTVITLAHRKFLALLGSCVLQAINRLANSLTFSFFLVILLLLCSVQISYGQKTTDTNIERVGSISDSLVKREMAYFTITDTLDKENKGGSSVKLKKIELFYSHDAGVSLKKGNWYGIHRLIHIDFEYFDPSKHKITYRDGEDSIILAIDDMLFWGISNSLPRRKVKSITFFHVKARHCLPDSAFDGIFEPPIYYCTTKKDRKKYQNYFKAYLSEDGWRMYIYMLNGKGKDRYEVTWIINGLDYYGRSINKVPE
jgi:hypothetical protein